MFVWIVVQKTKGSDLRVLNWWGEPRTACLSRFSLLPLYEIIPLRRGRSASGEKGQGEFQFSGPHRRREQEVRPSARPCFYVLFSVSFS